MLDENEPIKASAERPMTIPPTGGVLDDLYERLVAIARAAFADQHYEVAYHALSGAVHAAYTLHDDERLLAVQDLVRQQISWVNMYTPTHRISSYSAAQRGNRGVYDSLATQIDSMRLRLKNELQ